MYSVSLRVLVLSTCCVCTRTQSTTTYYAVEYLYVCTLYYSTTGPTPPVTGIMVGSLLRRPRNTEPQPASQPPNQPNPTPAHRIASHRITIHFTTLPITSVPSTSSTELHRYYSSLSSRPILIISPTHSPSPWPDPTISLPSTFRVATSQCSYVAIGILSTTNGGAVLAKTLRR